MQQLAGNRATTRSLALRSPGGLVQRHAPGTELPKKDDQVGEIEQKKQVLPEATRSKAEEATQTASAKVAGKAFQKQQKLTPGAMSLASAQKILQGAYGDLKAIVPGTIVVLADQPACAAKYDEVCIADGLMRPDGVTPWAAGDCAKDDAAAGTLTEGFAWKGIVYVNGQTTLVTATTHEILHNNAGGKFRETMGETFNEGVTEMLARRALSVAGVSVPAETSYPTQVKFTVKLQGLVGQPLLTAAYFGNPATLVAKIEELKGVGSWATIRAHAEALDEGAYNTAMAAKKGK